ncbi:toll-like receptor 2 isoform 2-T2 [Pholidichthys leucotaenia]
MGHLTGCYFTFLLLSLAQAQRSNADNGQPSCDRCNLHFYCNCSHSGFSTVPMVTDSAVTLDLSFNNITMVTNHSLKGHRQLKTLDLHGNRIAEIHPSAFDSLWSLEKLDLSENQLTALNHQWFSKLSALQELNLLNNPYSHLGSPPVFQELVRLRKLAFGGPALQELTRGDLSGVTQLEEFTVHANNLISDVSYPETPLTLEDLHVTREDSVKPFRAVAKKRLRSMNMRNILASDEAIINLLMVFDGVPLSVFSVDGVTLAGVGRWEKANWTDQRSIDEFFIKDVVVLNVWSFFSFLQLKFLLEYPRKVSVINSKVFVMPCLTSHLLVNLQYLDLSDNLLTDLTLTETLCGRNKTLTELRVLNISGNALKSLATTSSLVEKLSKLTHLDISRTGYVDMPSTCPWPRTLRYLNISRAKLSTTTGCLPQTLEVLDMSYNNLRDFTTFLPRLRELHLSGNKFQLLPPGHLFPNLQKLTIQSNTLNMFSPLDLQSYSRLDDLQAGLNKFVCSCEFVPFIQSKFRTRDLLTDGVESYICDSPLYMQGEQVSRASLSVVVCHRVLLVSVSCGVALFLGILLSVLLWRLHALWYLKMTWAWIKTKRNARRRQWHRDTEGSATLLSYDAFVSYSERDASWVENFLVPELEEPSEADPGSSGSPHPLTLCLHKRDFLPGNWIVDNIMSAMERSRRTIFVLSENFVQSDWCRYELDFSHFWLFDGRSGREAAILILLEPLSGDDIPKRFCKLRKLMSSTTYLVWPQEEERRGEFWRSLRNALREDDD